MSWVKQKYTNKMKSVCELLLKFLSCKDLLGEKVPQQRQQDSSQKRWFIFYLGQPALNVLLSAAVGES